MEKKTKLTISGGIAKKSIKNIDKAKTLGKNSVVIEKQSGKFPGLPENLADCFSITTEFFPKFFALSIFLIDFFAMPPDIVNFVFFSIAHLSIFVNNVSCRHD